MLDTLATDTPTETRLRADLSSWQKVNIRALSARGKKRFRKRKGAVVKYLTSDTPLNDIATQYRLSAELLSELAEMCLMQHEDGTPWGYRALLPGVTVIDHAPKLPLQDAATVEVSVTEENATASEDPPLPIDTPTDLALAVVIDESREDDIDTSEHEAITALSPADVQLPETPLPPVLQSDEDEELIQLRVALTEGMNDGRVVEVDDEDVKVIVDDSLVHGRGAPCGYPDSLAKKIAWRRQHLRKRRLRNVQEQQNRFYRVMSLAIVAVLLLGVLMPLGVGLAAYGVYNNVRGLALDGVNHLLTVKVLLPISKSDPMAALDAKTLQQAQHEFKSAEYDFVQLQQLVNRSDVQSAAGQLSPDYANKLVMAKHLLRVALDVSRMGGELSGVALIGANVIHGSPLASGGSAKPLISAADVAAIEGAMVHALYYIDDIRVQMSLVQLKDLPISDKQKAQLVSVLGQLPRVHDLVTQAQGLVSIVSWLLGVGHERRFLVQTMDRGELRPSGGFTGQYGILQVQDGRMAPFSVRDVALLDYAGNGVELGRPAPPEYRSWMTFGNWGLRDSNLSGDYPTTARMSMQVFQEEGGGPVDGDISFTPTFIAHILDVTGPIHVPDYNEIITSKNLEERLHYYQQNYNAIALEHQKTNDTSHAARKAFTSLVGKMLLDRVRHLPTKQLINIVKGAIKDIQSRDLEIYFTNPEAEGWLAEHGYTGGMDTFTKQDGFMVVQSNISISKASTYVHTTEHDDVVLDAQGGATHNLTITLDYQPTGPVYGFDTYADYIRVYVPQSAQFLWGDGFDTGQCLSAPANGCFIYKTYFPGNARYCPDGNYDLGDRGFQQPWRIDSLGSPTELSSDLPGRAMWGGLTETPKNCTSYITLSWYVPHVVQNRAGQSPYALLVQKQGGYVPTVEITVDASALPIKGVQPYSASGDLVADRVFALAVVKK